MALTCFPFANIPKHIMSKSPRQQSYLRADSGQQQSTWFHHSDCHVDSPKKTISYVNVISPPFTIHLQLCRRTFRDSSMNAARSMAFAGPSRRRQPFRNSSAWMWPSWLASNMWKSIKASSSSEISHEKRASWGSETRPDKLTDTNSLPLKVATEIGDLPMYKKEVIFHSHVS